ncbi:hypothetical protein EOM39_06210, partial [Candidatus Gracilibacteria bacterium]|nr:hypothetical protein [Candidatus Gracilibacteria bacterium]
RRMVFSTFACRKGYGSHKSLKYLQELIFLESRNAGYDNLYYLKLDFSKYFFSINHELLKRKIFKHIKNPDLQYTINLIIDSCQTYFFWIFKRICIFHHQFEGKSSE